MFYKTINLIKVNLNKNNKILKIKLNKNDFLILKIFIKLNLIKNIKKLNNNYYLIFLNINFNYTNIINLYKPSKFNFINLKELIKVNRKKSTIFYISTNKGVINNFEAEKKKIGGTIIMNLWL